MSALRPLMPLTRQATARLSNTTTAISRGPVNTIWRRALNNDTAPTLYSAHATVTGGRNGHVGGDGLQVDLTMPSKMGGPGGKGKTNPEELFAAGYGACFQSAMGASAAQLKIQMPSDPKDCVVDATVHLVGDLKALDMGLRVDMKVRVKGLSQDDLDKVIQKTVEVCPYSRATKGNVTTNVDAALM